MRVTFYKVVLKITSRCGNPNTLFYLTHVSTSEFTITSAKNKSQSIPIMTILKM